MAAPPVRVEKRVLVQLLALFLLWRGALLALVWFARVTIPERRHNPHKDFSALPDSRLLDSFVRWDASWYFRIADHGYALTGGQSNVAFFPGFPYATRAMSLLTGDLWIAGLVVSNLSLLAALYFVFGLTRHYLGERESLRASTWVLMLPTSFFLSAYYSEGLFLLTVAASLYFYERDQLLLAGIAGFAAAFTRSTGVLLFPALVLGLLHREGYRLRALSPRAAFLLLIPLGIAAVAYIQHEAVGDALAFVKAQTAWGRESMFPLATIVHEAHGAGIGVQGVQRLFDSLAVLALFVALAASFHVLDLAHSVFIALMVLVPLSSGKVLSMERFAACVVPIYPLIAGATRQPEVERYAIYTATLLLTLHAILFANWYFAG
jgi:hypothetical protein